MTIDKGRPMTRILLAAASAAALLAFATPSFAAD